MNEEGKLTNLIEQLGGSVSSHLECYVTTPALQLIRQDLQAQDDIASLLMLHRILRDQVLPDGHVHLDHYLAELVKPEDDAVNSIADIIRALPERDSTLRTVFFAYIHSLANWNAISILSASYISALILSRSLLECLVNLATSRNRGTFREKVAHLEMLAPEEKDTLCDLWEQLCRWSHPYGQWLETVCPVLVSKGPTHHPDTIKEAIVALGICTDFAFAVAFSQLGLDKTHVRDMCAEYHIDHTRFMMIRRRISEDSEHQVNEEA